MGDHHTLTVRRQPPKWRYNVFFTNTALTMAHLHPTGWQEMSATGAAAREIETLAYLKSALADTPYHVYHGVHWTNVENGFSVFEQIDFIIVAPSGRVLL